MDNENVNKNTNKPAKKKPRGISKALQADVSSNITISGATFLLSVAPPKNYNRRDPEQLEKQLNKYINAVIETGRKAGNMQLYYALGIDNREVPKLLAKNDQCADILKNGIEFCRAMREIYMSETNEILPGVGIFWQKNYDGLKDVTEIAVNNDPIDVIPADKLIENARTLPVDPEDL